MMTKRLPTLLGLGFLILALGALAFLWNTIRGISSKAAGGGAPQNVRITNQTDSGFSVSYFTSDKVKGSVNIENVGVFADVRDTDVTNSQKFNLHYFDVRGLKPSTTYILNLENSTNSIRAVTGPNILANTQNPDPIYSRVVSGKALSSDIGVVYLNFNGAAPISALVKPDGSFLVPLSNIRNTNLDNLITLTDDSTTTVFIQAFDNSTSTGICNLSGFKSLSQVQLGKNINCTNQVVNPTLTPTPEPTKFFPAGSIQTPAEGETIEPQAPTFGGKAIPGKILNIEVHSDQILTGTVKTDASGNWRWTAPSALSAGEHSVVVSYIDELGKKQTLVRNFVVLAAGSPETLMPIVVGTPSATVVVTPTKIISISISATPVVTKIVTPTTADSDSLMVLLTGGVFLVILGISLVFNYAKRTDIF